jgi:hypothetical protein
MGGWLSKASQGPKQNVIYAISQQQGGICL